MNLDKIKSQISDLKKYLFVCFGPVCVGYGDEFADLNSTLDKVGTLLNGLVALSTLVAVGMLIYGGYQFVLSAGDEQKADQGQKMITGSIIGLIVIFLANMLIRYVINNVFV